MYRGRPPPRRACQSPPRPYQPEPGYRSDRNRPRIPYPHSYNNYRQPDSYSRSPPHRYPSPGLGRHRDGHFRSGDPSRQGSLSPRKPVPLDQKLVITVGNELTGASRLVPSHHYDRSSDRGRSRSRSRSRSKSRGRSKSRARSRSRSKSRARSRGRSKSRGRSRSKSRARSRGRSKSRGRSRSRSRRRSSSYSPDRSRVRSGRCSKSRSRSRSRSRGKSWGRGSVKAFSRGRSRSRSVSNSSSSSSADSEERGKEFRELETARRRKELTERHSLPTKSILKKHWDSEDSRSADSPKVLDSSSMSKVAEQLLLALKGLEPDKVAPVLAELQSSPLMAQHANLDSDLKEILKLLAGHSSAAEDMDDEEKFLYGDSEEPKAQVTSEPVRNHSLELYRDVTEETLYGDFPDENAAVSGPAAPAQSADPACPPGTEPLEEDERQALEEYEKMQDLLKTIGLDLGVAEIGRMAARTKERLQGNKGPAKTPTRRRRFSSGSSDGGQSLGNRSRSASSRSSSRSGSGRGRGSWSSRDGPRRSPAPPRNHRDAKELRSEPQQPHGAPACPRPPQSGIPIPTYPPPPPVHGTIPQNYPPPGYGQYASYLPYMPQQWPPMYPPPNMSLPPPPGPENYPPPVSYNKPLNKVVPEASGAGLAKSTEGEQVGPCLRRMSEEQNNQSQKQKVLEEREKLRQERDVRMKKKEYLMKELERLRKQQGEFLRKKRREKGGHKDPLLEEISLLQEEVMKQISLLRSEHEAAEKKRRELETVALILGLSPSERPSGRSSASREPQDGAAAPSQRKRQRSPEGQAPASSSPRKQTASAPQAPPLCPTAPPPEPFEYYDAGNHWCHSCNLTSGSMFDFFTHCHSKTHRKTLDPYDRPWASTPSRTFSSSAPEERLSKPAKGSEFLLPVRGFFCLLCQVFSGDAVCAEEHVTTHTHNQKYQQHMREFPLYEQRRNLDRQAGRSSQSSGTKRKQEDEESRSRDKEERSRQKKEKRDKRKEEDPVQEEEAEEKPSQKEGKILEEEKPSNLRKEEEEFRSSRKEDKHRCTRQEESKEKPSRREEDDRARHKEEEEHRYRYRRDEDGRYDHRPKYQPRADKHAEPRPKNDRDDGKAKAFKKPDSGKSDGKMNISKSEPPAKPHNPPKILCGPSPAMKAKLRKQNLETAKTSPVTPVFGKFMWKKKENLLATEAQKAAAEFIKDDEAADQECLAKSVAAAKEIAQKLASMQNTPPPWGSAGTNQEKPHPSLPAASPGFRRPSVVDKPAPPKTSKTTRPPNAHLSPQSAGPMFPVVVASNPVNSTGPQNPAVASSSLDVLAKPRSSADPQPSLVPPLSNPSAVAEAPAGSRPVPKLSPLHQGVQASMFEVNPAPQVSGPAPSQAQPVASQPKASPPAEAPEPARSTVVTMESDVAAPGVPESEQTQSVFIRPPPLITLGDGAPKSEKPKRNLAAAKAQDLFGIFYSSGSLSGGFSITRAAKDDGRLGKNQAHSPAPPRPQPPAAPLQPGPGGPEELQAKTVWSLQSTQGPEAGTSGSKTSSQTHGPELHQPVQPGDQNQSQSLHPDSLLTTPNSPSGPDSTQRGPEPQSPPHAGQEGQPDLGSDPSPASEPKPGSKARGKANPMRRASPASGPVHQTRSQTRSQTQQQQLNQPEQDLLPGDPGSAAVDCHLLDTSDPGAEAQPEAAEVQGMEVLDLPSDIASLDFESGFNFE